MLAFINARVNRLLIQHELLRLATTRKRNQKWGNNPVSPWND